MSVDTFFQDELFYLLNQSKLFADTYPQSSQFLLEKNHDPDVDRTLEGFAFLTGMFHAKIEKEYPQLVYGLIDMLWPNYLRPTPSMTIIEFSTKSEKNVTINKGFQLKSKADKDNLCCTFKTTRTFDILPLAINNISNIPKHNEITIDFIINNNTNLAQIELSKLNFYIGDNPYTSTQLYFWLNNYLAETEFIVSNKSYPQPDLKLTPVGFKQEDSILVYPKNTYMGYRLLQEYFCFPEGYLFIKLNNFSLPKNTHEITQFSLRFKFKRPLPVSLKIRQNSLKINCTPAINLFKHDAEPIILNGYKVKYPLIASYQYPQQYEIFAIEKVTSWLNSGNTEKKSRIYHPFESFKHQIEHEKGSLSLYYKADRTQEKNSDIIHYSLSFVREDEIKHHTTDEIISVELLCTNKDKAAKLKIGDICLTDEDISAPIHFRNITRPSITLRPVINKIQHQTTISTLSLNYLSLLNKDALIQILHNYNISAIYSKQAENTLLKIIDNIESFTTKSVENIYRNLPIQGLESTLYINQSAFNNEGELYLFSSVLAHFYSHFATVNSFHSLIVINSTNQEKYQWAAEIS